MIRATFDTSVYIRALHFGGPAASLLHHARFGNIRIDISTSILDETLRVLREKFAWNGYMLHDARRKLHALTHHVSPSTKLCVIKEDPEDDHVLECAIEAGSDFIVTEDKDLLRLREFGNARVVNIATFVALITAPRQE